MARDPHQKGDRNMGWLKAELKALWKDFDWLCILVFSWMIPLGVMDSYGYGGQHLTHLGYMQKSFLGYYKSLSFWVVPTIFFLPHFIMKTRSPERRPKRMAMVWTVLSLLVIGGFLDCIFGWRAFRFDPSNGNYLGIYAPAVGEQYLGTPGIPLEEFLFYFLGALDIVLLYHWSTWRFAPSLGLSEPALPKVPGKAGLAGVSKGAFVWGFILIVLGVPLKLYYGGPGADIFPMYYTFLILVGFIPVILIYQSVKNRVDWIAFAVTALGVIATSGLYEIGLAVPHHWWGYEGGAMIGDMLDVVQTGQSNPAAAGLVRPAEALHSLQIVPQAGSGAHGLAIEILGRQAGAAVGPWPVPVEVMLVWIIIPFFCIFAFELLTAFLEDRRSAAAEVDS